MATWLCHSNFGPVLGVSLVKLQQFLCFNLSMTRGSQNTSQQGQGSFSSFPNSIEKWWGKSSPLPYWEDQKFC